jgi:hypothetical protein
MSLIDGVELKKSSAFFDSYFNSIPLLLKLKRKIISAIDTIRSDKKHLPTELKKKEKLDRGDDR